MKTLLSAILMWLVGTTCIWAQKPAQDDEEEETARLAKATQNPVASLTTLPFQNNLNYPIGDFNRYQNVMNIQPVIPIGIGQWNLITRAILPVIDQGDVNREDGSRAGLGDLEVSFFFSPAKPGKLIWGVGPAFLTPTATASVLGTGKWSVGPTAVALVQPGHWTIGVLASNVWSFAGQDSRSAVNSFLMQPFINYNMPKGWFITTAPIITSNWKLASDERWLVPFGGGVGRVFKIGKQAVNAEVQNFYNAIHADTLPFPQWQLRMEFSLLFPTQK